MDRKRELEAALRAGEEKTEKPAKELIIYVDGKAVDHMNTSDGQAVVRLQKGVREVIMKDETGMIRACFFPDLEKLATYNAADRGRLIMEIVSDRKDRQTLKDLWVEYDPHAKE